MNIAELVITELAEWSKKNLKGIVVHHVYSWEFFYNTNNTTHYVYCDNDSVYVQRIDLSVQLRFPFEDPDSIPGVQQHLKAL